MDGAFLDFKPSPVPTKQLYTLVSIWTKNHVDFGGTVPAGHEPYYAYFGSVNRLVCDQDGSKVRAASGAGGREAAGGCGARGVWRRGCAPAARPVTAASPAAAVRLTLAILLSSPGRT